MSTRPRGRLVLKKRVRLRDLGHGQFGFQLPSGCEDDVDVLRSIIQGDLEREDVDVDLEIYDDGTIEAELLGE